MAEKNDGSGTARLRKLHHLLGLALNNLSHARKQIWLKDDPSKYLHLALRNVDSYWKFALATSIRPSRKDHKMESTRLSKAFNGIKSIAEKAEVQIQDLKNLKVLKKTVRTKNLSKRERLKRSKAALSLVEKIVEKTSAHTARLPIEKLLSPITGKGTEIADVSFDIYCPKAYKHHTRLTMWMPRIMANGDHVAKALKKGRSMLKACGVRDVKDYVIGLNSRVNQYKEQHLLMLDFDDVTYEDLPIQILKREPGVLLRTASGFHFLGLKLYDHPEWKAKLKSLRKVAAADHIDLSLQRGYATLRMSASPRKPFAPIVWK